MNKKRGHRVRVENLHLFRAGKNSLLFCFFASLFFHKTLYNKKNKCYNAIGVAFYKVLIKLDAFVKKCKSKRRFSWNSKTKTSRLKKALA